MPRQPPQREPGFVVRNVEAPPHPASFGSIERYVEVSARDGKPFRPGEVTIEYAPERLGWVDPETLRVFRIDREARTWHLVPDSGPRGRGAVRAHVDKPGLFGVAGLPRHPAVREALHRSPPAAGQAPRRAPFGRSRAHLPADSLRAPQRAVAGSSGPIAEPPGGSHGSPCDFCMALRPPANGMPECQLLERPEGPRLGEPEISEAARAYAVTSEAWVGVILPYGAGYGGVCRILSFALDPPRATSSFDIGQGWCTSLAVTAAADRFYVVDVSGPEVRVDDATGTLSGTVALPLLRPGWQLDCALSPDGGRLYVAASYGLIVVDTATLAIVTIVSTTQTMLAVTTSDDGATIAVAGVGEVLVVDAASLGSASLVLPAGLDAGDVVFTAPDRLLAWCHRSQTSSLELVYIDLATGATVPITTSQGRGIPRSTTTTWPTCRAPRRATGSRPSGPPTPVSLIQR